MFRYQFNCSDEAAVRDEINRRYLSDRPTGKTIWGIVTHRGGAHFIENDKRVRGYYILEDENPDDRGLPFRVYFRGRFCQREEQTVFTVWVYPSPLMVLFLAVVLAFCAGRLDGLMIALVAVALSCWGLSRVTRRAADFFRGLFRPYDWHPTT